ncbi:Glycosyl hydrolases family 16 [Verrucomicrobium sp. GAS474]|uniref:glycoside hydrolase family 16 protein n=1 Tax=Verrucomicrobium sp. GAS474 TaxID=1882831 RepID=UPI00087B0574|nr:glycoside hydrolase family 16 protein [Verrucomicrobium sp. GAS474]SDT88671.1 Glycosyl hydrolases family 16 [Verrucomicrobium sp. GAS474]
MRIALLPVLLLAAASLCGSPSLRAAEEKPVLDLGAADAPQRFTPSSGTIAAASASPGVEITVQPGAEAYPGVSLKPAEEFFDFAAFGYVEAKITNPGTQLLVVNLRADNLSPLGGFWNSDSAKIPPGETRPIRLYFSKPVNGFRADRITRLLFFVGKIDGTARSFRIDSIVTGGAPGELAPNAEVRTVPQDGVLYAEGAAVDPAQLSGKNNGAMSFQSGTLRAVLPATAGKDALSLFRPAAGAWNLRYYLEVRVVVENAGSQPVTPSARLESQFGPSDTVAAAAPLAPGAKTEIVIPFAALVPWKGGAEAGKAGSVEGSGSAFASNVVQGVALSAASQAQSESQERVLKVVSIRAFLPEAPAIPEWVGKKPPGDGDWVKTFDDEFDGTEVDASKWSVAGENWYDKVSHYSKENVTVSGGLLHIRYEKKTGFHNDDPTRYQTDYATGFLETFDKWAQRYGYFECRIKLSKAPGLWPAFWLMPNRSGPEKKGVRGSTSDGGMEFDVMEHLAIWGPYRYNIAMHWDGYGKDHRSAGSKIYFQPDKDGFVTAGLLWTPGSAIYYANGREVLRLESPRVASVPEMMMFTLPSGGWDGNVLDPQNPQLPDECVVDYVRCWQRRDLASDADTTKIDGAK